MAFKMKGHTLPGPYQQKKQVDKANAAAEAANAARDAARAADKEFKTFAYDYAEPGTARADSLGGSYTEENMKRFNELGGIREDAYKDADKAYKAYEKAADKAKKKGATSSPAKQRKKFPEDREYGPTDHTRKAAVEARKKRMEKEYKQATGKGEKFTGKRGRGLKDADLEELSKTGSKFNKKDIKNPKSPAKKKSPYKVAPIVAKLAPKVIGAVASSAMSKKDD